jgi:protein SHQ1
MLTPRFTLSQDDDFVIVTIYAPFTHVAETEVFMDATDFRFFSKPYFLRLHFPSKIQENDAASAKFDADSCSYIVKCPKETKGEFFSGLDMITELCKPKGASTLDDDAKIQVLSEEGEEEDSWYFDQEVPAGDGGHIEGLITGVGFGLKHTNVFNKLLTEYQEILDVKYPERLSIKERKEKKLKQEEADFTPEHYLCDLYEPDDTLSECLHFIPKSRSGEALTSDQVQKLTDYVKKDIRVQKSAKLSVLYGLVDILFASSFDLRTNFGQRSSESGWAISKLSATLACNDVHDNLKECVIACFRRSLIYPLQRNWELCLKVLNDLQDLLRDGQTSTVKVLLDITQVFIDSEGRYILNQLFIDQYVAWVQSLDPLELVSIADEIQAIVKELSKADLALELVELEAAAEIVLKEEAEEAIIKGLETVEISSKCRDSDDDSSSDSSTCSDDSSSSSSSTSDSE